MAIPFEKEFDAPYEQPVPVSPLIRRLLARNPGPFTFKGTGVAIIGKGEVAVIDPGPDDPEHLAALRAALKGETVTHILVTHTHRDHSPAAKPLKAWTGAPTYGFGPHGSGKSETGIAVEEGGDRDFVPDIALRDGDIIDGSGFTIECVHTPGHTSNHMCYALKEEKALFTGDHVMGWSTTVVAPPDGDMGDYLASLRKLLARDDAILWPTHGGPVRDPKPFLTAYLAHRLEREQQILDALRQGATIIPEMVERIYLGLDPRLKPAAALSVLAHLLLLTKQSRVTSSGEPGLAARFRLTN
ncbi:MAG TPA: MBL fold metallo-hydrolase [Micropepsaceae bacterium]|nr:MBL fold metallo-hydrolase [Micropepsaceae bacterium]